MIGGGEGMIEGWNGDEWVSGKRRWMMEVYKRWDEY